MIIKLNVKPNSNIESIGKVSDSKYIVNVKGPAEDDRANKKVVNILAKEFGLNFRKIKIKNPTSREKIVEIED
jgi:uncharacterized protein YggU (UPF0235/DUF167 family)